MNKASDIECLGGEIFEENLRSFRSLKKNFQLKEESFIQCRGSRTWPQPRRRSSRLPRPRSGVWEYLKSDFVDHIWVLPDTGERCVRIYEIEKVLKAFLHLSNAETRKL